jgi:hypothetical protein
LLKAAHTHGTEAPEAIYEDIKSKHSRFCEKWTLGLLFFM